VVESVLSIFTVVFHHSLVLKSPNKVCICHMESVKV
jgi:hypothetical protein